MWITPKTNWVASDYFNATDYNRIVENISLTYDFSVSLYGSYEVEEMMRDANYSTIPHADDWNAITNNIDAINRHTYNLDLPQSSAYFDNASSPNYEQFNKWESNTAQLMNLLKREASVIPRLGMVLNRPMIGNR